ncbi:MAG: FadR/GntR family transcriptional regulator [Dehalococcoidia bacterium]
MTTRTAPSDGLRPLRRQNLSQEIAAILAEQIARGHLKPAERLPSERDLSEAFAVSRSSVREAIKTLESRGLVEGRQGGGTFVRSQGLDSFVQVPVGPVSVTEVEVHYLYEVREMLDPGIARLAAERATPSDVAVLSRMLERHERRAASHRYTSDDDTQFHLRLAKISGNPVLIRLLEGVMRMLAAVREPALRAAENAGMRVNLASHWEILRAVEAHDAEHAAAVALYHHGRSRDTALAAIRGEVPSGRSG